MIALRPPTLVVRVSLVVIAALALARVTLLGLHLLQFAGEHGRGRCLLEVAGPLVEETLALLPELDGLALVLHRFQHVRGEARLLLEVAHFAGRVVAVAPSLLTPALQPRLRLLLKVFVHRRLLLLLLLLLLLRVMVVVMVMVLPLLRGQLQRSVPSVPPGSLAAARGARRRVSGRRHLALRLHERAQHLAEEEAVRRQRHVVQVRGCRCQEAGDQVAAGQRGWTLQGRGITRGRCHGR